MIDISAADFKRYLSGDSPHYSLGLGGYVTANEDFITFQDIRVSEYIVIENIKINRKVSIQSGQYYFELKDVEITERFYISGGNFLGFKLHNINCSGNGSFSITGGEFPNAVSFHGGQFRNMMIEGGVFSQGLWLYGGEYQQFQLSGGVFKRWVELKQVTINRIYIHRIESEYGIQIRWGKLGVMEIWHCPGLRNIYLHGPLSLEQLSMRGSENLSVSGSELTINHLNLSNTTFGKSVNLYLSNSKIALVDMTDFYNFGYLSFSNLLAPEIGKSGIRIKNSNLGRVDFIDCDLSAFEVDFENSRITDISILGGQFNNIIKTDQNNQIRLFNGQLKKVHENKGDQVAAAEANAADLNAYLASIIWNWRKPFSDTNFELINLGLNRWSSDHGNNWRRALLRVLQTSIITYGIYLFCLGYRPELTTPGHWHRFLQNCAYYWEFLNPIHKADYIAEKLKVDSNNASVTIEALSRIVIAYFVYQLIQAFRKHGKRN